MESLWKGLSGMDAARAAMGQGWPFAACPWSGDGAREPDEVGPDARGKTFCLLLGRLPKVSRCKSGTGIGNDTKAASSRRKEVTRTITATVDEKSVIHPTRAAVLDHLGPHPYPNHRRLRNAFT